MSLPPKIPQAPNRLNAQQEAADQLEEVEREMTGFERATLRWAKVAVGMSAVAAFFVCLQWWEMHQGGADTHDLAVAAGKQADRMKDFADRMKDQADRTKDLVDRMKDQAGSTAAIANATKDAVAVNRDTLKFSQRSYITIGRKDGVVAQFIVPKDPSQKAELVMYFQNSGHIPAKLAWGTNGMAFIFGGPSGLNYTHPFKGIVRTRSKTNGSTSEAGESATIAGDSVFMAAIGEIPQERVAAARMSGLLISGNFQYCDELGTDSTHTFSIAEQNVADDTLTFGLSFDQEMLTSKRPSTSEIEYLSPCATAAERKQNQKPAKRASNGANQGAPRN